LISSFRFGEGVRLDQLAADPLQSILTFFSAAPITYVLVGAESGAGLQLSCGPSLEAAKRLTLTALDPSGADPPAAASRVQAPQCQLHCQETARAVEHLVLALVRRADLLFALAWQVNALKPQASHELPVGIAFAQNRPRALPPCFLGKRAANRPERHAGTVSVNRF
jgi:hypothetical protein